MSPEEAMSGGGGSSHLAQEMAKGLIQSVGDQSQVIDPPNPPPSPPAPPAPDAVDVNTLTDEQINEYKSKPVDQLSDKDKEVLKAIEAKEKAASSDDDEEVIEVTDEQIEAIKKKPEAERTQDEKDILKQLEEQEGQDDNSPISIAKKVIALEELSQKQYEANADGFRQLLEDAVPIKAKIMMESMMEELPVMQQLYDHVYNKGLGLDSFLLENQQTDHSKFNVKTEEGAEQMLRYSYSLKGLSPENINILVEAAKNEGKLLEQGQAHFKEVDAQHQLKVQQVQQEEARLRQEQYELQQKTDKEIRQVLSNRKIMGLTLSQDEARDFSGYLTKVDQQSGLHQSIIDWNNASVEKQLLISYILFKDFNVKGIEGEKLKQQQMESFNNKNTKRVIVKKANEQVIKDAGDILDHYRKKDFSTFFQPQS